MAIIRCTLICLTIIYLFVTSSVALSSEWVFYGKGVNNSFEAYYDKESIMSSQDKILKVWTKYVYSETGKHNYILFRTKVDASTIGYENFGYTINECKINCKTKEWSEQSTRDYDLNARLLYWSDSKIPWRSIPPDSLVEQLFKIICVKQKKRSAANAQQDSPSDSTIMDHKFTGVKSCDEGYCIILNGYTLNDKEMNVWEASMNMEGMWTEAGIATFLSGYNHRDQQPVAMVISVVAIASLLPDRSSCFSRDSLQYCILDIKTVDRTKLEKVKDKIINDMLQNKGKWSKK